MSFLVGLAFGLIILGSIMSGSRSRTESAAGGAVLIVGGIVLGGVAIALV